MLQKLRESFLRYFVQTSSGACTPICSLGTGSSSSRSNVAEAWSWLSPSYTAKVEIAWSCTSAAHKIYDSAKGQLCLSPLWATCKFISYLHYSCSTVLEKHETLMWCWTSEHPVFGPLNNAVFGGDKYCNSFMWFLVPTKVASMCWWCWVKLSWQDLSWAESSHKSMSGYPRLERLL
jgi:hypothetical protein